MGEFEIVVNSEEVYKSIKSEIKFFHEVLSNPNINEENKRKINRVLGQKLDGYLNPTVYLKPIKIGGNIDVKI